MIIATILTLWLLCARLSRKHYPCNISFDSVPALLVGFFKILHLQIRKLRPREVNDLLMGKQWVVFNHCCVLSVYILNRHKVQCCFKKDKLGVFKHLMRYFCFSEEKMSSTKVERLLKIMQLIRRWSWDSSPGILAPSPSLFIPDTAVLLLATIVPSVCFSLPLTVNGDGRDMTVFCYSAPINLFQ